MALLVFLLFAAVITSKALSEAIPTLNSAPGGNNFVKRLDQHITALESEIKPISDVLISKGCLEVSGENTVSFKSSFTSSSSTGTSLSPNEKRFEACTNLTNLIAFAQTKLLQTYYLSKKYKSLALETFEKSIDCYESDKVESYICLIDTFNSSGEAWIKLNKELEDILKTELQISKDLFAYYRGCFGSNTSELRMVATDVAEKLC